MLLVLAASVTLAAGPIQSYRGFAGLASEGPGAARVVVLRAFTRGGQPCHWVVDPATLTARVVPAARLRVEPRPWSAIRREIADTAYGRALHAAEGNEKPLQGAGLTHVLPDRPGIDLTVDLCPSQRPLDRRLFTTLVQDLGREERPVPVAIALTGTGPARERRRDGIGPAVAAAGSSPTGTAGPAAVA